MATEPTWYENCSEKNLFTEVYITVDSTEEAAASCNSNSVKEEIPFIKEEVVSDDDNPSTMWITHNPIKEENFEENAENSEDSELFLECKEEYNVEEECEQDIKSPVTEIATEDLKTFKKPSAASYDSCDLHVYLEANYNSNKCDEAYSNQYMLDGHMIVHMEERPYKCNKCNKAYSNQYMLDGHMIMHKGEGPYNCNKCGKSYTYYRNLLNHMNLYTSELPYKCKKCVKTFSSLGSLKRHIRVHTGEYPYECSKCNEAFRHSGNLKVHIRKHIGECPYRYNGRQQIFIESSSMKYHTMPKHSTEIGSFKCNSCCMMFTSLRDLKVHWSIPHW